MLELDGLPLPAIVYTLLTVAMATLFLSCCWCKKKSTGSKLKSASVKGSAKEKTETAQTPTEENKSGNGAVAQCPSPEPKPAAELGDFSVVQRETEILRSYRKPAPPKNRARQSRAPRAMNRSTENLDIFTELSEDELKASEEADDATDRAIDNGDNGRTDDNKADQSSSGVDEVDAVKHRSQEMNGAAKRDTRSSMLADIEKTLASLHDEEDALEENKNLDLANDKVATTQAETSGSSLPAEQKETNSAQSSPTTKGKVAPKVSPKPAPRKRGVSDKPQNPVSNPHDQKTDYTAKDESKTEDNQTLAQAQLESTAPSGQPVDSGSSQATCAQAEVCTDMSATTDGSKTEPPVTTQESCQLLQGAIIEHKVEVKEIKTTEQIVASPTEETNVHITSIQATDQKEETDDQKEETDDQKEETDDQKQETDDQKQETDDSVSTPQVEIQTVHTSETVVTEISPDNTRETSPSEATANKTSEDEQLKVQSTLEQQTSVNSEPSKAQKEQSPEKRPLDISKEIEKTEKSETVDDQSGKGKLSKIPVRAGLKSGSTSPHEK